MKQKRFCTSLDEYFKNNSDVVSFVEKHLLEDSVYLVGIIVSELIQGIKNDKEQGNNPLSIDAINFIDMKFGTG